MVCISNEPDISALPENVAQWKANLSATHGMTVAARDDADRGLDLPNFHLWSPTPTHLQAAATRALTLRRPPCRPLAVKVMVPVQIPEHCLSLLGLEGARGLTTHTPE
jgi:hypothetical protein